MRELCHTPASRVKNPRRPRWLSQKPSSPFFAVAQLAQTSTHLASCASAAFTVTRSPPSGSVVTARGIVRTVPFVEVIVAVAENSAAESVAAASHATAETTMQSLTQFFIFHFPFFIFHFPFARR